MFSIPAAFTIKTGDLIQPKACHLEADYYFFVSKAQLLLHNPASLRCRFPVSELLESNHATTMSNSSQIIQCRVPRRKMERPAVNACNCAMEDSLPASDSESPAVTRLSTSARVGLRTSQPRFWRYELRGQAVKWGSGENCGKTLVATF